jgi:hypothetical protein
VKDDMDSMKQQNSGVDREEVMSEGLYKIIKLILMSL